VPPLAAGALKVEQPVQQVPHIRAPRTPFRLGGRDQRLQEPELVIRQRLTGSKLPNQCEIGRHPHDALQVGSLVQRRQEGRDQPLTPDPSPFPKRAVCL
jgi:hypothetical protein